MQSNEKRKRISSSFWAKSFGKHCYLRVKIQKGINWLTAWIDFLNGFEQAFNKSLLLGDLVAQANYLQFEVVIVTEADYHRTRCDVWFLIKSFPKKIGFLSQIQLSESCSF